MKSGEAAQELHRVKTTIQQDPSCLVVFLCKTSRKLLALHETRREAEAESAEALLKLKSCSSLFSSVCESDFPSTCWANRIAVKYFLWVTHKSVGGDEARWELDDVLNNDLLFSSWQAALAGRVTRAAFPGCAKGNQGMFSCWLFCSRVSSRHLQLGGIWDAQKNKGGNFRRCAGFKTWKIV